jgi:hypothetical protein
MAVLKKIGVLSFARVYALVVVVLAFLMAVIQAIWFMYISSTDPLSVADVKSSDVYLAIVTAPIFWGLVGFLLSAFAASLYNFFASYLGGVKLDLEDDHLVVVKKRK